MFTKDNLDEYIRQQWAAKGFETGEEERVGISIDELVKHSAERRANITSPYLDLWVGALDEFVSWLISLLTVFYANRRTNVNEFTDFERSVITLLSKVISDSLAIRQVILTGYDVSARALLRSTAEYMEVLVAILHEPSLAEEFVKTDDLSYAQKFWSRYIARKSIRSRVQAAWVDFFGDSDSEAATWFANWGHSAYDILSGDCSRGWPGSEAA